MNQRFGHLAQRLFNVPLMITPSKAEIIIAALADRLGIINATRADGGQVMLEAPTMAGPTTEPHAYDVVEGVAIIPIEGTLVQKLGTLRPFSGMTGYDGIRQNFGVALEDPAVRAIVLDIQSPGGEVAGCFDLVDDIYNARGIKPIHAILTEYAYSAGYAIASAADRITVPRTGGTGSIGVVWMHVDWSKAIGAAGINVTFVKFGARKVDGAGELPLSAEALEGFQQQIDEVGELFVETVARNRGISADVVRATEAAIYQGPAGVAIGLADAVMAPHAAFSTLLDELG